MHGTDKWFLAKGEVVTGPFTAAQVREKLEAAGTDPSDLIWGRGMSSWLSLRLWTQQVSDPSARRPPQEESTRIVNENTVADDVTTIERPPEIWHYALDGKNHGPFSRQSLVSALRRAGKLDQIMIWTKGMKEWASLFEFHDLLAELGVNKRRSPRCEIKGAAVIRGTGLNINAQLHTISEGGLSVYSESGLEPGQSVRVEIQSAAFRGNFQAQADVRYVMDGVVGLKFTEVNAQNKEELIQFLQSQGQTKFVLKAS